MNRKRLWLAPIGLLMSLSIDASGAVHHSKAQAAYFAVHDKCVRALKAARNGANGHAAEERRQIEKAAREQYRKCEAWAHLVWKYYPKTPPTPAP
jgi:hypothetical protein